MPAHHKSSTNGVGHGPIRSTKPGPHEGPTNGDASYRLNFTTDEAFLDAMQTAARLEARGLHRRAWRVRLNLDGPQPTYPKPAPEQEAPDTPPPNAADLRRKRKRLLDLKLKIEKLSFELEEA